MFSIIIPSFNNIEYLKICINSIKKNSKFDHELIIYVQNGSDGTLEYVKSKKIKHLYNKENQGLCIAYNECVKISNNKLLVTAHDDMYFCKDWDTSFKDELNKLDTDKYYLSGSMVQKKNGHYKLDCGDSPDNFSPEKLDLIKKDTIKNLQGSHWMPALIHKNTWETVGGLSEEFFPGLGSDPDFNMKLWLYGVRIFKSIGNCKVYHFSSVTSRKGGNYNYGSKIFLLKWRITVKFFKKHYLKTNEDYLGPLIGPVKNFYYYLDLIKCKLTFFYYKFLTKFN